MHETRIFWPVQIFFEFFKTFGALPNFEVHKYTPFNG